MAFINQRGATSLKVVLVVACIAMAILWPLWRDILQAQNYTDLEISKVDPVQVVFDPDIGNDGRLDLVLERETALLITIHVRGLNNRMVDIEARLGGGVVVSDTLVLSTTGTGGQQIELFFTPKKSGIHEIEVEIDSNNNIVEHNEGNNIINIDVDIKRTNKLNLAYIKVNDCFPFGGCYGPLTEIQSMVDNSNEFIKATYPLADTDFSGNLLSLPYFGDPIKGKFGIVDDILSIGVWGLLAGYGKALGVVPRDYFSWHNRSGVVGITQCNRRGGLVTEGFWTSAAHELGHMFGICGPEEYNVNPPGNPASGYWVSQNTSINNSVCFMGDGPLRTLDTRWVDVDHYEHLFQKFLTNSRDPEVLVVTALLHNDGSIDFRSWFFLQNGDITESEPGNYAVRVLDNDGNLLDEVSIFIDFALFEEPIGLIPTDVAPLLVAVPYQETAAVVEIVGNGRIIASLSSTIKILHDAVDAIPDFGFDRNPDQRRNALHNKIDAIENMLDARNTNGAQQNLIHDFKPSIERWIIDDYTKTALTQLEKDEVLSVIDSMIERVENF